MEPLNNIKQHFIETDQANQVELQRDYRTTLLKSKDQKLAAVEIAKLYILHHPNIDHR